MLNCLSNDSKRQMRLNIKRHRQKLLQYLENTNDTVLKPKIRLVSNDIEKSNLNHNVQPKTASNTDTVLKPKIKLVSNDTEKSNLNHNVQPKTASNTDTVLKPKIKLVSNDTEKSNLNHNVQPKTASNTDTVLKPKIKLVSNGIEKSNLNHNVQPKTASNTEVQTPKLLPTAQDCFVPQVETIKIKSYRNKPIIQVTTYESVINTKPKNPEVLTDNNIINNGKKYQTRSCINLNQSSITVNQLPPNIKVNIQDEPLSNFKLKPKPLPNIEIKDPEPAIKKLKEQLIEELLDSSGSEEIDDNISDGDNWNEVYEIHDGSDEDENDSSKLRLMETDGHKQLAYDISKEKYMYDNADSGKPVLDTNYPTTNKRSRTRKPQLKIDQPKHRFRKPLDRKLHNAKERACRESIAKMFANLRKSCSYLNSNRRVPSKHSILLAAKKECDLLKQSEKNMLAEKKILEKANETLKQKLTDVL